MINTRIKFCVGHKTHLVAVRRTVIIKHQNKTPLIIVVLLHTSMTGKNWLSYYQCYIPDKQSYRGQI